MFSSPPPTSPAHSSWSVDRHAATTPIFHSLIVHVSADLAALSCAWLLVHHIIILGAHSQPCTGFQHKLHLDSVVRISQENTFVLVSSAALSLLNLHSSFCSRQLQLLQVPRALTPTKLRVPFPDCSQAMQESCCHLFLTGHSPKHLGVAEWRICLIAICDHPPEMFDRIKRGVAILPFRDVSPCPGWCDTTGEAQLDLQNHGSLLSKPPNLALIQQPDLPQRRSPTNNLKDVLCLEVFLHVFP